MLSLKYQLLRLLVACTISVFCVACVTGGGSPRNLSNICQIFKDKPHWYKAAKSSSEKWGGPVHLPMAFMYQESRFKAKAKPPMEYFLGFIPTGRPSNAYGYSQALKSTWAEYQQDVGSRFKNRDSFSSAYDFIQWYMDKTYKRNGVSKWDAYAQYLNYHEGQGGYSRGSHNAKQWLLAVANKVNLRSKQYSTQLSQCQTELDKSARRWF